MYQKNSKILFAAVLFLSSFYIQAMNIKSGYVKQVEIQEHEHGTELTAVIQENDAPEKVVKIHKNRLKPTHAEIFVKHASSEISIDLNHQESEELYELFKNKWRLKRAFEICRSANHRPLLTKKEWQKDIEVYMSQSSSTMTMNRPMESIVSDPQGLNYLPMRLVPNVAFQGSTYTKNNQSQTSPASKYLPEEKGIAHLISHPELENFLDELD